MNNKIFSNIGRTYFPGSSPDQGKTYQDISWLGYDVPAYRHGVPERAKHINDSFNVKDKRGLDIGCSVGSLSLAIILRHGASFMMGIDADPEAINIAEYIAKDQDIEGSVKFISADVMELYSHIKPDDFDFCIWYSSFHWVVKMHGIDKATELTKFICKNIPVLFFETPHNKQDKVAGNTLNGLGAVKDFLTEAGYATVNDLGMQPGPRWGGRHVFKAQR